MTLLVGREAELAQLREVGRQARDGRGRVVVVSGDAGLGKSALVEAAAEELAGSFDITWGRAWELSDAPAYFPLWPCLKSLGIAVDPSRADAQTFELWEQVLEALVAASVNKPVLWIIEDLHVADRQSLDLLCFLAQAIRGAPVVLLTTTRPNDSKRITRLARDGREIRLAPLEVVDLATLAARWLGRSLQPGEASRLAERTGGNPLFVVECARAGKKLLDSVPPTVAQVVAERVEALPESARSLLADAAIVGNEVTAATLATMRELLPARVIDELGPALKAGMLEELAPGRYKFSHALVRDAIEAGLAAPGRIDAHARAERALAALPASPRIAIERARHALASITPGRAEAVLATTSHALDVLEQQGTFDRAAALVQQMQQLRVNGELPAATSAELVRGARLLLEAGKFAESRALSIEAAALARAARDPQAFATAALTLGGELHPGIISADVVRHLEEARDMLGDSPSPARCRVMARLAAALQPAPDPDVPNAMARTAIADARATGDRVLLEDVLYIAISALTDMTSIDELVDLNREHLLLARELDHTAHILRALVRLVLCEGELGNFAVVDAHTDELLRLASTIGHPRLTWRAFLAGSMRAIARGQFAESERFLAEAERAAQLTDDPSLLLALDAHRFHRALDLHRDSSVTAGLQSVETAVKGLEVAAFIIPTMRALVGARTGNVDLVSQSLAGFPLEIVQRREPSVSVATLLGELYAASGSSTARQQLLTRLLPVADLHHYFGHTPFSYMGPVRRVIGLLELSLGATVSGEANLRRALETCRALGFQTWVARLHFELGELEEAGKLAAQLGIRGLAKRAHAPGAESSAPPTRPALGFAREGDVWRISYGVRVVRVPDTRGMELIAKLVERPGEELHVLVLAGTGNETLGDTDAGEALDQRAAKQYRERIAAIDEALARASAGGASDRAAKLEREREFLVKELARAFGLGNAPRKVASASERARVNVQRRIKDSLGRIGQQDGVIAEYLRTSIRTGTFCMFRP